MACGFNHCKRVARQQRADCALQMPLQGPVVKQNIVCLPASFQFSSMLATSLFQSKL
jgi:hypothetical protein